MKLHEETNWRLFFSDPNFHGQICKSIIRLLALVLDSANKSNLISKIELTNKLRELRDELDSDITQVYNLFFSECALQTTFNGFNRTKLKDLTRKIIDQKGEYYRSNKIRVQFLNWRVREAQPLALFLREARNAQSHDTKARQHMGWLLAIPANIIRLLELCPVERGKEEEYEKLRSVCLDQINEVLDFNTGQSDTNSKQENNEITVSDEDSQTKGLKDISSKLDEILNIVSTEPLIQNAKPAKNKEAPKKIESLTHEEEEPETTTDNEYPEIELLTPQMVRNELDKLAREHSKKYKGFEYDIPAENFLQVAIIQEILSGRPKNTSEILTLPDVSWRVADYKKSMQKQFGILKPKLEDILNRSVWDE